MKYRIILATLIALSVGINKSSGQQMPDTSYNFRFYQTAYPGKKGPVILIDEAHHNFHTKEGGFFAFGKLLEQDGYQVNRLQNAVSDQGVLEQCRILVIANPLHSSNTSNWVLPTPSAFSKTEIIEIEKWVKNGGRLLLIADHMPFAGAADDLAQAFGFDFVNGFAFTRENSWPPSVFSAENGTLKESPVTKGANAKEEITGVSTFTGSAFKSPEGSTTIFSFSRDHYALLPDTAWAFSSKTKKISLEGFSQGAVMNYGKGRIAVFGEAAMFTAQIANGNLKVGFNSEDAPQNAQFILNLIHWMDGNTRILSKDQLELLLKQPSCLEGFRSNQSGPLSRIDAKAGEKDDSTFTVEKIKIPSDGVMINGWLYLPLGKGKFPLIVLTNGGGDGSRPLKSLSDWMAPILAHCGYAAFVHDKRGTGESEGSFVHSTYEDFIRDAGNCAKWLSKHPRINPDKVGIMGGSEGGLIAVSAACRYPEIKYVISFAGTVVPGVEDRLNAQLNGMVDNGNISDSLLTVIKPLWEKSFRAWASHDPAEHQKVDALITDWRKKFNRQVLPYMKSEMDTIPAFSVILPTWNSMGFDYLTELATFTKPWLAIFGEVDRVVPTQASIENIDHYMNLSKNKDCTIAVIPNCGHAPVHIETRRLIRIDHLTLNWLNQNVLSN